MSYKIREEESLGVSIRRALCSQIDSAIDEARADASGEHSPVHATRRHLKKARAALQLLRPAIKRHVYEREARRLRNVGRLISDIRDAEVRLATVKQLRGATNNSSADTFAQTEELLAFELDSFLAAFDGWQDEAVNKLQHAGTRISQWPVAILTRDDVCAGLRDSYKRGRAALAVARRKQSARAFHDLRKRVKTLGYQLRLLRPIQPVVFHDLRADLKALGEHLGHAHDLCFVAERLRAMGAVAGRKRRRRALESAIKSREQELQRSALALAERFYCEKPREFSDRIAQYLACWQRTPTPQPLADAA